MRPRLGDPLLAELQGTLESSQKLPSYLSSLFQEVVALKAGQHSIFHRDFLVNIRAMHAGAYRLLQLAQDPLLTPSAHERVQAEMRAAVALTRAGMVARWRNDVRMFTQGSLAMMRYNADRFPMQTVLKSQRSALEHMQLTQTQQMRLVEEGLALFAKQRALSAQRSSLTGSFMEALRNGQTAKQV
ncbi:hypothetical protein WJX73_001220 [Symbiochloris irregularis]|uniref:Uncharacterized protein n=1 Tax=Symbiochloris irregularis TaxID=706552 RepID=A0AAW1P1S5_9CHLO